MIKYFIYLFLLPALVFTSATVTLADETQTTEKARNLIAALGCKGCHRLSGEGGSLAPELDQIGTRKTQRQIREQLAAHTAAESTGFMPNYNTTPPEDLETISDFLYHLKQ